LNSTHPDYEASALQWSRARGLWSQAGRVKRFVQTIFSVVFGKTVPVFAPIRRGFLGQAVRRKTCARVSRMNGILTTCPP
jgi:hypothetical protein